MDDKAEGALRVQSELPKHRQVILDRVETAGFASPKPRAVAADVMQKDATVVEMLRPLFIYLSEEGATELCVNRPGEVFVEVGASWKQYPAPELTMDRLQALARAIAKFTEQEISPQKPILSAMLPGGERVQIVVPPALEQGTISFSVRVPSKSIKSLDEYERDGARALAMG